MNNNNANLDFNKLSEYSIDELYLQLFNNSPGAKDYIGSPGMRTAKGRKLFKNYKEKLRKLVCVEWQLQKKIETISDIITLMKALAAVIAPILPKILKIIIHIRIINQLFIYYFST